MLAAWEGMLKSPCCRVTVLTPAIQSCVWNHLKAQFYGLFWWPVWTWAAVQMAQQSPGSATAGDLWHPLRPGHAACVEGWVAVPRCPPRGCFTQTAEGHSTGPKASLLITLHPVLDVLVYSVNATFPEAFVQIMSLLVGIAWGAKNT